MVYAIQAELAFSTAGRRDQVLADLTSQLTSHARWVGSTVIASPVTAGPNGLVLDVRFITQASQSSIQARIDTFATGPRLPLTGSFLRTHDCTHDSPNPEPCVGLMQRDW